MSTLREKINKKIKDIKEHPELHRHTYESLIYCCSIDGVFIAELQEAHERYVFGGRCDVVSGPCSCGAWH